MKHTYWIASAALFLSACSHQSGTVQQNGGTTPGKAEAAVVEMPANSGGKDDYVLMKEVLTFTPEQKGAFEKKLAERNEGFAKWEASARGQEFEKLRKEISAARAARQSAKVAELEAKIKPIRAERDQVRADLRREFDTVLTLEQQKKWAARNLNHKVMLSYRALSLSEAQKDRIYALCSAVAEDSVKADTYKSDPYLLLGNEAKEKVLRKANADVLTPAQRARIGATRPSTIAGR